MRMASFVRGWALLSAAAQQTAQSTPWWELAGKVLAIPTAVLGLVIGWYHLKKARLDTRKVEQDLQRSRPSLRFRYLICKQEDIVREIAQGDFHQLPMDGSLLLQTPAGRFLEMLVSKPPGSLTADIPQPGRFETLEEYTSAHPDALLRSQRPATFFPYFEAVRVPTQAEIESGLSRVNPVVQAMMAAGAAPEEAAYVVLGRGCGKRGFMEIYQPRSLWAVYLEVANQSERPVVLESIEYLDDRPEGVGYRPLGDRQEEHAVSSLSEASIAAQGSIVVPVAAILPPLDAIDVPGRNHQTVDLPDGRWQALSLNDMEPLKAGAMVLGPAMWPKSVRARGNDETVELPVHELDLGRVYVMDRGWSIGSCPHLFYRTEETQGLRYERELFDEAPGVSHEHDLVVPGGVVELIVAELEDETTTIEGLQVDGRCLCIDVKLERGQELRLGVEGGQRISLKGHYETRGPVQPQPRRRNDIIAAYVSGGDPP